MAGSHRRERRLDALSASAASPLVHPVPDSFERLPRSFRLYHPGPNSKNAFRDGNLVSYSLPWKQSSKASRDAKNMMHTFRLLLSAISIFETGAPRVRFEGPDREFLLQVRAGSFAYPELLQRAEAMVLELEAVRNRKPLPAAPDEAAIDQLLQQITADFEANHV
jgi:hypothetical protein